MKLSNWCSLPLWLMWIFVLANSFTSVYAQTTAASAPSYPKYKVMGVVYAPPGSASSVTYGNSSLVGSTDTMSNSQSTTNTVNTSVTAGFGIPLLFSVSATYDFNDSWTESNQYSNSIAIQTTTGNSVATMGPISSSLGVDHDNDVIYIWLNPVLTGSVSGTTLNWTGLASNSCDPNNPSEPLTIDQAVNGCDPNQYPYPDIVGIPVWCLKNPYFPAQGCAQWLPYTARSWDTSSWGTDQNTGLPLGPGLTLRDYADILQADPFVALNANAVNVCHPTYGPGLDPNLSESTNLFGTTSLPLAPSTGTTYMIPGVPGTRINYADPYDAHYQNFTTTPPLSSGFFPRSCTSNNTSTNDPASIMSRFQPYGAVEYPVPGPNGLPSTYTGTFQYSQTQTNTIVATDSHTVSQGVSVTGSFTGGSAQDQTVGFDGSVTAGYSNSTTWQQQSSNANTTGSTSTATYSITGPQLSDNYVGPATYDVFLDNVYGTFAFYSYLEQAPTPAQLGTIGITVAGGTSSCSATGSFPCYEFTSTVPTGSASTYTFPTATVTLTNTSTSSMVLAGPALTFSDPGFQITPGGTDNCSNQQLTPSGTSGSTCTVSIEFAPSATDWPSGFNATSRPVFANIIAAGTADVVGASGSNQNILVVNYGVIEGVALPPTNLSGATLVPQNEDASVPNAYVFNTQFTVGANAQDEVFIFKNTSNANIVLNAYTSSELATDMILSDSADFKVLFTGDTCNGATVASGSTCSFTLQFLPTTAPVSGTYATRISATNSSQSAVAIAGATGTAGTFTVTPYYPPTTGAVTIPLWTNNFNTVYIYDWAEPITLTNNTIGTATFATNTSPTSVDDPLGKNYSCEQDAGTGTNVYFTDCVFTTSTTSAASSTNTPLISPWGYIYGQLSGAPLIVTNGGGQTYSSITGESIPGNGGPALTCTGSLAPGASCTAAIVAFLPATTYQSSSSQPSGWDYIFISPNGSIDESGPNTFTAHFSLPLKASLTATGGTTEMLFNVPVIVHGTNCNNSTDSTDCSAQVFPQIVISGGEKKNTSTVTATHSAGSISLEQVKSESASAKVGSFAATASYPPGATPAAAAQSLVKALNAPGSPVKATANGSVITLTSSGTGSKENIALAASGNALFSLKASGKSLTGGKDAVMTTKYDTGRVSLVTHGRTAVAYWKSGSTPQSLATELAASVNEVVPVYWKASAAGNVVSLTPVSAKSSNTVEVSVADSAGFSPISFSALSKESGTKTEIVISGAEKDSSIQETAATPASGTLTLGEVTAETISAKVGSFTATASISPQATPAAAAQTLAKAFNVSASPVKATVSGSVISLTSLATGSKENLNITATGNAEFTLEASGGTLTGGKDAETTTVYDTGTVALSTHGIAATADWGSSSTPQTVATALAASVNKVASAYWKATATGATVTLTPVTDTTSTTSVKQEAATASSTVQVTVTDTAGFKPESFSASTSNK